MKKGFGNGRIIMWAENGIGYGMTATLDKAGRIVLPKKLREKLHLKPGAKFTIEFVGDKIEIEKEAPKLRIVRKGGVRMVMGWEGFDAAKAVTEMHEELAGDSGISAARSAKPEMRSVLIVPRR